MRSVHVGLVADPSKPTVIARRLADLEGREGEEGRWDVDVVSEPFTVASEESDDALSRLSEMAVERSWDLAVGLTDLPLRDEDGRYLLVETDPETRTAMVSLPALGGLRVHSRTRRAVRDLVTELAEPGESSPDGPERPRGASRARVLLGMVLANRPWLLVPGLKSALVASITTGAIATINSTVWLLAGSLSPWRLVLATVASLALVVGWLVVDGGLWDRPEDDSPEARERSRLYNTSTLLTLTTGAVLCYAALYVSSTSSGRCSCSIPR